jgi:hypothetical protein
MPSQLQIVAVNSTADRRKFVDLPFRLQGTDPHWRPPLKTEIHDLIGGAVRHNPWFEHAELGLWLAIRDGVVVGRISAQVDRLVQERMGQGTGQWGMFECIDDAAVAAGLFEAAESWLRQRGMTRSLGPFSLSIWDECGLLVRGFDTAPTVMMGHNPPYHVKLVEALGYGGIKQLHAYGVPLDGLSERIGRVVALGEGNDRIRIRRVSRARFSDEVALVLDILNDAWSDNWGFVPMTALEIAHAGKKLKQIVYEDLMYVAEVDGKPAAFMLTLPDLNELTADLAGRLLPFGWAKLLWRLRNPKVARVRVPLMGVRKALHGSRLASLMVFMMIERTRAAAASHYAAKEAELGWVLDDNEAMRAMAIAGGGQITKTYRIYERQLG